MCIAVVHFTEIICCNTEIMNVISVFDNRIVSMFLLRRVSQPAVTLGCDDCIAVYCCVYFLAVIFFISIRACCNWPQLLRCPCQRSFCLFACLFVCFFFGKANKIK